MSGFVEGEDRTQATLFPERIDDYITEDSPVRVVHMFIDDLDISGPGFRTEPNATGRQSYHPKMMLKLYVYGYLDRVQSSRRLEREAQRNVELMWLTGRLAPDFKTIADFRKDNGDEIRACEQAGIDAYLPKPKTSPNKAKGQFELCHQEPVHHRQRAPRQSLGACGRSGACSGTPR